ncbi:uncharacterized protein LOC126794960 isoform X1 [Argentina anserina]|uniref:uncharacterized protein LOC126794960 isoform X1 n=1 Tax=Argentina anserina TaxID=57926 RepID=UPI00217687D0|nr:uncharacterized protein LOC126794960 isoform X1 [Potentilla anserina]
MPGPGPHLMYAMSSGVALTTLTNGRFCPHHTLIYTINSFFIPDIGSFTEWLASLVGGFGFDFGSELADTIHHPLYDVIILGLPLCILYSWLSRLFLLHKLLDSFPPVPLTKLQCILLVSAGSFSHFFLDHLFEENGHSGMYTWVLSTGWWEACAPINPDAVVVVGILCIGLIASFIYINRVKPPKPINKQSPIESLKLIIIIASMYYF